MYFINLYLSYVVPDIDLYRYARKKEECFEILALTVTFPQWHDLLQLQVHNHKAL